jgi:eukaryotic-like serine/threonine-protein kinase
VNPEEPVPLLEVAAAVADQTPVDWDGRRRELSGLEATLDELRALQALALAHRGATAPARAAAPRERARWGPLELRRRLGAGSFGEVWRAWDPALQREVALKLRRDGPDGAAASRRWLAEGRALARVRHRNVLTVYGAAEHDGRAGMWTELIEGASLEQWLARHGPLGAREAGLVGIELTAALAAVHAAGVVHGDVKAANVLRVGGGTAEGAGRIVLADFGSTRGIDAAAGDAAVATTPLACAPEVLAGADPTPRSDVYSLGVLLYRLLTGRHPYEAGTRTELERRIAAGPHVPLRERRADLPAALVAAIERALARDPAARWGGAAEFEAALGAALELAPAARAPRRAATAWIGAALAAAAVIGIAIVATRPRPVPAPTSTAAPRAAPAGAAAPVAPAPLALDATLERTRGAELQPLGDGAQIAPGDRLDLAVDTPERAWVYVLDEDGSGALYVLFPVAGSQLANPLAARARVRLPGTFHGRAFDWQVTSAGGDETILAVASRAPLEALDRVVARAPGATSGRAVTYAALPPAALGALRGVGGMAPASPGAAAAGGRLKALARELRARHDPGVWLRAWELFNPGS